MPAFGDSVKQYLDNGIQALVPIIRQYIIQERVESAEGYLVKELFINANSAELKLAAMIWLLKQGDFDSELSSQTGFEPDKLREAFRHSPKVACFPVVSPTGKSCLAHAAIYEIKSSKPRALALCGSENEECSHLAKLSGTSCLIGFNSSIEGNSWQLAVMAALLDKTGETRNNLAYSGIVSSGGEIILAEEIGKKISCCKAQGTNLVYRVKSAEQLNEWLNSPFVPLPVVQFNGSEEELSKWQTNLETKVIEKYSWFSYEVLDDFYGIGTSDLAIYGEGNLAFDAQVWQEYLVKKAADRFNRLENTLLPKKALWFYSGQISTLQMGIGAIFGFKRAIGIMQLDFSTTTYREVFTLYGSHNARELKNVSVEPNDCLKVRGNLQVFKPENKELGMIIFLGSHNPIGEAKDFCRTYLQVENFLVIKARENQGVLGLEENWLRWVQEINSLLNQAREEYHWKRIHLFQTAPTALCMALGIAIGHFLPVDVYHYQFDAEDPRYRRMFSLDKIHDLI